MHRRSLLFIPALLVLHSAPMARPRVGAFKFGILKATSDGGYLMSKETTQLPKKLKRSGFRFGLSFENPSCQSMAWYEKVHFPAAPRQATGNFERTEPTVLTTKVQESNQGLVVDDFWFDEEDPLGKHRMELYVDEARVFTIEFTVVSK